MTHMTHDTQDVTAHANVGTQVVDLWSTFGVGVHTRRQAMGILPFAFDQGKGEYQKYYLAIRDILVLLRITSL